MKQNEIWQHGDIFMLGEITISFSWYFCRSQELIKNAILANDFLKNLDQCQIQAVVEAMYSKEYEADNNVITEGETGTLHAF